MNDFPMTQDSALASPYPSVHIWHGYWGVDVKVIVQLFPLDSVQGWNVPPRLNVAAIARVPWKSCLIPVESCFDPNASQEEKHNEWVWENR